MAKPARKKASAKVEKTSKKVAEVAEVPAPVVADADAPADGTSLSIADLQAIAQVIDAAVRRGAFGASEVTEVGAIYTKLTNFLQVIADQQRATEEAQKQKGGS